MEEVTYQQNIKHIEPPIEEMPYYRRMFNLRRDVLDTSDVKYKPIQTNETVIDFTLESDDQAVLKLEPDKQLDLFPEEKNEETNK